jgi:Holliday junction resolvase RusA-like endonuclease
LASLEMRGRVIFDGPVALDLQCFYEVPPSWPKWKQELALNNKIAPTVKPDADNVMKAVKDALNGIVWLDDVQVVMGVIFKAYALAPCVVAKVRPTGQLSASIKRQPTTQP